jgi:hypothetical protein
MILCISALVTQTSYDEQQQGLPGVQPLHRCSMEQSDARSTDKVFFRLASRAFRFNVLVGMD